MTSRSGAPPGERSAAAAAGWLGPWVALAALALWTASPGYASLLVAAVGVTSGLVWGRGRGAWVAWGTVLLIGAVVAAFASHRQVVQPVVVVGVQKAAAAVALDAHAVFLEVLAALVTEGREVADLGVQVAIEVIEAALVGVVGLQRMAQMMVEQLVEIMPELKEVSPWHTFGQRRSLDDYGRVTERRISDDVFQSRED